ncbi:glycosyltransferase [Candidatus Woesearchaeota archaeon]|nr:glycosyltransferase [Candidatus Woesearchaeota archaeon]
MDLSVIVRVKDDIRIKRCIESIDENVEKMIVLNTPSDQVRGIVDKLDSRTIEISENNLGKAHNAGIDACSNEKVLLMDSDCVFNPGTIRTLFDGLREASLSKGRVVFTHKSFVGRIVALSREYHVSDKVNAYAPPLAFSRDIKNKIGGYYFDEDLFWTEDHEFDQRVQRANLRIKYEKDASIEHDELTMRSDLRSSFHYGAGYYEGIAKGVTQSCFMYGGHKRLIGSVAYDCVRAAALPLLFADVKRKKGILPAAFMCVWMGAFSAGYYSQALFNVLEKNRK